MSNKWNLPAPNLVVSFVGEEEHFQVKPWLRDTLRKGLVKAAQSTGLFCFVLFLKKNSIVFNTLFNKTLKDQISKRLYILKYIENLKTFQLLLIQFAKFSEKTQTY